MKHKPNIYTRREVCSILGMSADTLSRAQKEGTKTIDGKVAMLNLRYDGCHPYCLREDIEAYRRAKYGREVPELDWKDIEFRLSQPRLWAEMQKAIAQAKAEVTANAQAYLKTVTE